MKTNPEKDLPIVGDVFNLAGEVGEDPARLIKERLQAAADAAEARAYNLRMQRTFKDCPGFIGGDLPDGEQRRGSVVVEPARVKEAIAWLKKRFAVNPSLRNDEASGGLGLEILSRRKPVPGSKRLPINWAKPEQFTLSI